MTLQVNFDRDIWLYIPKEWPWESYTSFEQWRDSAVDAYTEAFGYSAEQRSWLAALLEGVVRGCGANEHRFAFMPQPHEVFSFVSLYELPTIPGLDLEQLLGLDDPSAIRAPVRAAFDNDSLGRGEKSLRFVTDAPHDSTVIGVAHWVWRLADRDVLMVAGGAELANFDELQTHFDELARQIRLLDINLSFVAEEEQHHG